MSKTTNKFSPEVRERAVLMVAEQRAEYGSEWEVMKSIAAKIGCSLDGFSGRTVLRTCHHLGLLCRHLVTGDNRARACRRRRILDHAPFRSAAHGGGALLPGKPRARASIAAGRGARSSRPICPGLPAVLTNDWSPIIGEGQVWALGILANRL
jgi:hypothetical protein